MEEKIRKEFDVWLTSEHGDENLVLKSISKSLVCSFQSYEKEKEFEMQYKDGEDGIFFIENKYGSWVQYFNEFIMNDF